MLENDTSFQLLVQAELEDAGVSLATFVATDRLSSALVLIGEREFDIVLTDLNLPDSTGIQTFERLSGAAPQTPVVVFSSHLDESIATQILRHGAQDYVPKSKISRGVLSLIIYRAIERHNYAVELNNRAQLLAESEARFRLLVEHATDVVLVMLDVAGRVQTWNAGAERTVGFTAADSIGRTNVPFQLAEDVSIGRHAFLLDQARLAGHARDEGWCQRLDGSRFWAEITLNAIKNDEGEVVGFAMLTHDLTNRKAAEAQRLQLEEKLRSAQKLQSIGRLASGLAHEINTPAQFISHNLEYVQQSFARLQALYERMSHGQPLEPADQLVQHQLCSSIPEALADSVEGINRVAKIVQAMKGVTHPGTMGENRPTSTDLNRLIDTAITITEHEWKQVAKLVKVLDPVRPHVLLFAAEFNQVILNLLVNAAQAIAQTGAGQGGDKGTITITTGCVDDWVEVRVHDTGVGIPLEIQHRIFEPFFTTKEVGAGTGQGLAMAHTVITQRHLGEIGFESQPGCGTTFLIRLPRADRETFIFD